ncbi:MAG: hypothetical protein PVF27_06815 [Gemmatimonadales bacterium]|jgi:hypothetical protein
MPGARIPDERGAMYEINAIIWPAVYGVTGYVLGGLVGSAMVGAVVGAVLGVGTALPLIRAAFYDVELIAVVLLVSAFFLPPGLRPWFLLGVCTTPWLRLGLDRLRARRPAPPS